MKIGIVGASGFIGSALTTNLLAHTEHELVLFSHRASTLSFTSDQQIRLTQINGTVMDANAIKEALEDCEVAVYLVHIMGEKTKYAKFIDAEHQAAENFGDAVAANAIKRVIYVGGMAAPSAHLTQHLQSRLETGEILRSKVEQLLELKTPMVIGSGGAGYEVLRSLVHRSPLFPLPTWVNGRTQPITLGDVVRYIMAAIDIEQTEHLTFEIGGPERLTYEQVARRIAVHDRKHIFVIRLPFVPKRAAIFGLKILVPGRYSTTVADMIGSASFKPQPVSLLAKELMPQIVPESIDLAF